MTAGRKPTKPEQAWLDAVREMGCIVCLNEFGINNPGVPHHMDGKTKPDTHFQSFNLCFNHHQEGSDCPEFVSRHPYKKRFEARYGTEGELLHQTINKLPYLNNPFSEKL